MSLDFKEITNQINHNGEKGTARENVLQNYLRSHIPDKYQFSKGTIIDCKDTQSKQVDIIIHDKYTTPCLLDMNSTKVIPIESVYAVIEVKSTLTKEELRKSIKNINSVKTLQKNTITEISYPTAGLIFAYDSDLSFDTIYKNFVEISKEFEPQNRVSCLCVLNKGIIIPVDVNGLNRVSLLPNMETVYALMSNKEDALLLFYLILMQLLTQIQVFPPDMVKYAQSGKMLDTPFNIPTEYLPEDGTIEFLNKPVTIADLKILQKNCIQAGLNSIHGSIQGDLSTIQGSTENSLSVICDSSQTSLDAIQDAMIDLTNTDKELLKLIASNVSLPQVEMAKILKWNIGKVKYYINKLKRRRIIERVGSSQKGYWNILIDNKTFEKGSVTK